MKANPVFVASDLLAQAEHDVAAQVILVTTSVELAEKVQLEVAVKLLICHVKKLLSNLWQKARQLLLRI